MLLITKPVMVVAAIFACMLTFADQASAQRTRLESRMSGERVERLGSATAKFEQRNDRIKFSCEAEDLRVSSKIKVFVNGKLIGTTRTNALGVADLNLDSRLGDSVPRMSSGDIVQVYNQNSQLIFKGSLRQR